MSIDLGRARRRASSRARSSTWPTARCACACSRRAPAEQRARHRGRDRRRVASRQGLNIPGPVDALPAVPRARTSSCCATASRSASTSWRCRSCAAAEDIEFVREHTRLPLIAKIEKPQAVEHAEADPARGRLRDGRARRPRHRAADRGRAARAEAAAASSPARSRARRSRRRRCSTRWSPPRARRAPRSPTSPTRSSTAPTP